MYINQNCVFVGFLFVLRKISFTCNIFIYCQSDYLLTVIWRLSPVLLEKQILISKYAA